MVWSQPQEVRSARTKKMSYWGDPGILWFVYTRRRMYRVCTPQHGTNMGGLSSRAAQIAVVYVARALHSDSMTVDAAYSRGFPYSLCTVHHCCACHHNLPVQVVMLSILGFGAFTKPLLAAMLKGDGEAAALAAHLSKIPLLG